MSISALAKQKMLRMECYAKFPYLIEVTHNDTVYRYANSDTDITFEGNTFSSAWFSLKAPERSENKIGNGSLSFSTIDQVWIEKIRNSDEKPKLRFVAIIEYDNDGLPCIETLEDLKFTLIKPSWNETSISFTMQFDERMDVKVPLIECNSRTTPAIV